MAATGYPEALASSFSLMLDPYTNEQLRMPSLKLSELSRTEGVDDFGFIGSAIQG